METMQKTIVDLVNNYIAGGYVAIENKKLVLTNKWRSDEERRSRKRGYKQKLLTKKTTAVPAKVVA